MTEQKNERIDQTKIPLKRVIGPTTAILLVAGNLIGTGVFKKIVPMAQTGLNETYILGAWVAAGIITLFGAFTIAGLSKLTSTSGGIYEYMRLCFGNFLAFLSGWTGFVISLSGSLAAVGFIFAQSVHTLIPLPNPLDSFKDISIGNFIYPFADSGIKFFAVGTIVLLTWLNYYGIKKGTFLNNIVTTAKIIGILFLIIAGLFFVSPLVDNLPITNMEAKSTGFISIFFAAMLSAFWAYDGFTNVAYIAGEIKNPKRNVALAVIAGVGIVMVLYLLINYTYIKTLGLDQIVGLGENNIAATEMAGIIMGNSGRKIISVLIMLSSFGTLNVVIILYARLYFRMAQEKAFFQSVAKVHPVHRTPYMALLYSMIWSSVLVFSGTFDRLTDMAIFAAFLFYSLLAVGLIKMKRRGIIKEKVPFYPWAPLIFILVSTGLLVSTFMTQPKLSLIGLGLMASGIPFYYIFKRGKGSVIIDEEEDEMSS